MPELKPLIRHIVQDCVLRLTDKGADLPVALFDINYQLDTIPTLAVVPAFGRPLFGHNERATLEDVNERDPVELILRMDGVDRVLFSGFVATIGADDNTTLFRRTQSCTITAKHVITRLAGSPAQSVVYTKDGGQALTTLSQEKLVLSLLHVGDFKTSGVTPLSNILQQLHNHAGTQAAYFPSLVLAYICQKLALEFSPQDEDLSMEDVELLVRDYDPANLVGVAPVPGAIAGSIAERFVGPWHKENCWGALVRTARHFFLHVVPFNKGVYVANPISLDRTPSVILKTTDYLGLHRERSDNLAEPVDGVALRLPMKRLTTPAYVTFPQHPKLQHAAAAGKYYHIQDLPDWLQPIRHRTYARPTAGERLATQPEVKDKLEAVGETGLGEYFTKVGAKVAKARYSFLRQEQETIRVRVPYREDLMPGSIVKLEASDAGAEFLGTDLVGMVTTAAFHCSNLSTPPELYVDLSLINVRTEADNVNDDLTFEGHPVYEGPWTGIDVFGEFLKSRPPPESKTPNPQTT